MPSLLARCIVLVPVFAVIATGMMLASRETSAHQLGEMTINHYSEIAFTEAQVRVSYVVDVAESSALE